MIPIFISWIYITLIVYCIGNGFHDLLKATCKIENTEREHFSIVCISGILAVTFLSTLLCLFIPLGLISNLIILFLAGLSVLFNRNNFRKDVKFQLEELRNTPWLILFLFLAFLFIIGFISFLPSSHHDDGLYYSTSIKWLQEYGTVKGLALVNPRIAFNSSWLILQANFGFQFLHAGLFNDLTGLFYLYSFIYFLQAVARLYKGDRALSNLVQTLFFLPLLILHTTASSDFQVFNSNMISSPSADLPTCMLISLIFIFFLKTGETSWNKVDLKELLIVFYSLILISIKLSAVPVLLLSVFIFLKFVRLGKLRQGLILFLSLSVLLIPWIIRNVLISGYLLFPFPEIDIFHVDWKARIELPQYYEFSTRVYAIDPALIMEQAHAIPISTWLLWFNRLAYIHRVLLAQAGVATFIFFVIGCWQLLRGNFTYFKKQIYTVVFVLVAISGILFWLFKGPDIRFGFGFIGIYCSVSLALFMRFFLESRVRVLSSVIISFSILAVIMYALRFRLGIVNSVFKRPLPYRQPDEMVTVPLNHGLQMNLVTHDDSWNAPLPVANKNDFYYWGPILRGNSIKDGFKPGP